MTNFYAYGIGLSCQTFSHCFNSSSNTSICPHMPTIIWRQRNLSSESQENFARHANWFQSVLTPNWTSLPQTPFWYTTRQIRPNEGCMSDTPLLLSAFVETWPCRLMIVFGLRMTKSSTLVILTENDQKNFYLEIFIHSQIYAGRSRMQIQDLESGHGIFMLKFLDPRSGSGLSKNP